MGSWEPMSWRSSREKGKGEGKTKSVAQMSQD